VVTYVTTHPWKWVVLTYHQHGLPHLTHGQQLHIVSHLLAKRACINTGRKNFSGPQIGVRIDVSPCCILIRPELRQELSRACPDAHPASLAQISINYRPMGSSFYRHLVLLVFVLFVVFNFDELVKSLFLHFSVIPAEAGIQ
jgi:hypothetical protein